jgi:PAS domain S-box-containing protein
MLGYSVAEWLATPNFWLTIVHPDDRERAARAARDAFSAGRPHINQFRWITKDRRVIWVETHSDVVRDANGRPIGMRGVTMEVTERKRVEEQLRRVHQSTAALSAAASVQAVAAIAVQHAMEATGASAAALLLIRPDAAEFDVVETAGYPSALIEAWRRFPTSIPSASRDAIQLNRPVLIATPQEWVERYPESAAVARQAGYQSIAAFPLESHGRVIGVVTLAFAIEGERIGAHAELLRTLTSSCAQALERARLYEAERRAREDAEAANRAKQNFLARLSHELRNPLNAAAGWVEVLRSQYELPGAGRALDALARSLELQTRLVNDVLEFARLEAGRLQLAHEYAELALVADAAIDAVRPLGQRRHVSVERAGELPAARLWCDPGRLQQVLVNLLGNAVKFTPEGGRVTLTAALMGGDAVFSVSDTGIGIPADALQRIFEPFEQLGMSPGGSSPPGIGLGLTIVRELVELHGGRIEVRSEPGAGTTMRVTIPAGHPVATEAP